MSKVELIDYEMMNRLMGPQVASFRKHIIMNKSYAVVRDAPSVFHLLLKRGEPLRVDDHRMGLVLKGHVRSTINLMERQLSAGTIAYVSPGSIVHPLAVSDDFEMTGFALFDNSILIDAVGSIPSLMPGSTSDFQLPVDEASQAVAKSLFDALWNAAQFHASNKVIGCQMAAIMHLFKQLHALHEGAADGFQTHERQVFAKFIALVNEHHRQHHTIDFYASRLCLTERYLGTLVRQASDVTAKQWIDRVLVTTAKVMLRHSNLTVAQIAYELNFPNPSFFSKFFLRLTGLTPAAYRKK